MYIDPLAVEVERGASFRLKRPQYQDYRCSRLTREIILRTGIVPM